MRIIAKFFSHSRYGPPTRTEYRLTVENLSSRVSWQVSGTCTSLIFFSFAFLPISCLTKSLITTRGSRQRTLFHRLDGFCRISRDSLSFNGFSRFLCDQIYAHVRALMLHAVAFFPFLCSILFRLILRSFTHKETPVL